MSGWLAFLIGVLLGEWLIAGAVFWRDRRRARATISAATAAPATSSSDSDAVLRMEHEMFIHAWEDDCPHCTLVSSLTWVNAEDWRDLVIRHREQRLHEVDLRSQR